jgi:hypothetical protein
MAVQPTYPRYIKSIEYASMTSLLQDFRRALEHESGGYIHQLDNINAAMILSDLCVFLGLSNESRRKILGVQAASFIDSVMSKSDKLPVKH